MSYFYDANLRAHDSQKIKIRPSQVGLQTEIIRHAERGLDYYSLDDMAKAEGVDAVLRFLAHNPTVIGGIYRHTNIPVCPYQVSVIDKK